MRLAKEKIYKIKLKQRDQPKRIKNRREEKSGACFSSLYKWDTGSRELENSKTVTKQISTKKNTWAQFHFTVDQINCTLLLIQCVLWVFSSKQLIANGNHRFRYVMLCFNFTVSIQFNFNSNWMRFNSALVYLFVSSVSTFNARFFRDFDFDFNDLSISFWNVVVWFHFDKRQKKQVAC